LVNAYKSIVFFMAVDQQDAAQFEGRIEGGTMSLQA